MPPNLPARTIDQVFAALIRFPGVKGSAIGLAIRLGEPGSTRDKIRTLGSSTIVIDQGNRRRETSTGGRR